MIYREYIKEGDERDEMYDSVVVGDINKPTSVILRNPEKGELFLIDSYKDKKSLRGVLDLTTNDIYLADDEYWDHSKMHQYLGDELPSDYKNILMFYILGGDEFSPAYTDDDYIIPPDEIDYDMQEEIKYNTNLRKIDITHYTFEGETEHEFNIDV